MKTVSDHEYTLVRHSGYGYKGDPQFQIALETRAINTKAERKKVVDAGGLVLDYATAESRAHSEMYPEGYAGIIPRAQGAFANVQIDGLDVYVPPIEAVPTTLTEEDLQRCPLCGTEDSYWLQEVGTKASWQPLTLVLDDEERLSAGDWSLSVTADDTVFEHYECTHCMHDWHDLDALARTYLAAKRAAADSGLLVRPLDPVASALAVFVTNTALRQHAELHDPKALEQARAALQLPEVT